MAFTPFTKEDKPTMANFNEKFLSAILEGKTQALDEGVKIATGSYTGTGTYGASNKNSLTFDFEPKFVIVQSEFQAGMLFWVSGMSGTVYRILRSSSTEYVGKITFSENTLTWYGTNAENQMNYSNYVYHYITIG